MTDEAKALVERLRNHDEFNDCEMWETMQEAADRIEAQAAEIERLRAALTQIARLRTDLSGNFSLGSYQSDIARAALGDEQ